MILGDILSAPNLLMRLPTNLNDIVRERLLVILTSLKIVVFISSPKYYRNFDQPL